MSRWLFSPHAVTRTMEMELSVGEVLEALHRPECSYPGRRSSAGGATRVAVGGRVAVVYAADDNVVITVLWAGKESRTAA
jgi:hypothetical protein